MGKHKPSSGSYLATAKEFLRGAETLAADPQQIVTAAFLAGFGLELVLHAHRMHAKIKRSARNHDLSGLWSEASSVAGSPFGSPPSWLNNLSESHREHLYRYRPASLHGYVLPPRDYLEEIGLLIEAVGKMIGNQPLGSLALVALSVTGIGFVSGPATMHATGQVHAPK